MNKYIEDELLRRRGTGQLEPINQTTINKWSTTRISIGQIGPQNCKYLIIVSPPPLHFSPNFTFESSNGQLTSSRKPVVKNTQKNVCQPLEGPSFEDRRRQRRMCVREQDASNLCGRYHINTLP